MSEIIIKIEAKELINAISALAKVLQDNATRTGGVEREKTQQENCDARTQEERAKTEYTIESVRSAFADYAKANGKGDAKAILSEFNASKVTELKESEYNAVMAALKKEG